MTTAVFSNDLTYSQRMTKEHLDPYFRGRDDVEDVINYEFDIEIQRTTGVDIAVKRKGIDKLFTIDLKTDRYPNTGNFAIETISSIETGSPGWLYKSPKDIDYIGYFFDEQYILYMINLEKFYNWIKDDLDKYHEIKVPNRRYNGEIYNTMCRLVRRDEVMEALEPVGGIYKIHIYGEPK